MELHKKLVASWENPSGPTGWERFMAIPALVTNSSEDEMVLGTVRRFVREEVLAGVRDIAESKYPDALVRRMGELGLLGLTFPESDGGSNLSNRLWAQVVEEIARISPSLALLLNVQGGLAVKPIALLGNAEQKERWLKPALAGRLIGAFGLTGPEAGSDAVNMTTTLRREGDRLLLNGEKTFITQGGVADYVVVFTRSDSLDGSGRRKVAAVIVEKDMPGFEVIKRDAKKIGMHGTVTSTLKFEDVEIPETHVLGGFGDGIKAMKYTLFTGRITISAIGLGIVRAALETSNDYVRERVAMGHPIGDYQLTQRKLAEMLRMYATLRLVLHEAAKLQDEAREFFPTACLAKMYAAQSATQAALFAQEIFGGMGYTIDDPYHGVYVGNLIGDARIVETGEGTGEMQIRELARSLGLNVT